jgi:imidazole glycerol-phosphate synthase subunit HisH
MVLVVDYEAGNLTSVRRALEHLSIPCRLTSDPEELRRADRIVFPGVGHATSAMANLRHRGLDAALRDAFVRGTPILGICLGAQIVLSRSEEGDTPCLDLVEGTSRRFRLSDPTLKIPHMGWNQITITREHPVVGALPAAAEVYFVHSYFPEPMNPDHVLATCDYGGAFAAALGVKNLVATQFHPEKSGPVGLRLLERFARWDGAC